MPFVKVAETGDVPVGRGAFIECGPVTLALFNAGAGRFYALHPVCPHEDGPLADGWIEGDRVVCPWHGFDFGLADGRCGIDEALAVAVYPVRVTGGAVEVEIP